MLLLAGGLGDQQRVAITQLLHNLLGRTLC
jgi:hypothetical protein